MSRVKYLSKTQEREERKSVKKQYGFKSSSIQGCRQYAAVSVCDKVNRIGAVLATVKEVSIPREKYLEIVQIIDE